jgi:hypothetical protein
LNDSSTALAAVHVPPEPTLTSPPPDPGFTEATAVDAGAAAFWKLPLASDTRPKPTASDKIASQARHLLRTADESPDAFKRDGAFVFIYVFLF